MVNTPCPPSIGEGPRGERARAVVTTSLPTWGHLRALGMLAASTVGDLDGDG